MRRRTVNVALLSALLVTLLLNWRLRLEPERPNFEFLPGMVRTARFNAYSENPNFRDGATLRNPVEGTIPRGLPPLHFANTPEDAIRAGDQLQSPVLLSDEKTIARGAAIFANFCQHCHGADGAGNGPVVQRGFPAPPSLLADNARTIKNGQLFHIVTYGQKNMPAHARQLGRDDRWNVVAYIRSLQAKTPGTQAAVR
jgi:mono/diheme cytochrome c family protein